MNIGIYAYQTYGKKDTNADIGLERILKNNSLCLDILIAPEYTNISEERAKELSLIDSDVLLIPGTNLEKKGNLVYNTAKIFREGQNIFSYDKVVPIGRKNYSNIDHFNNTPGEKIRFANGNKPGFFYDEILDLNCGVEICADNFSRRNSEIIRRDSLLGEKYSGESILYDAIYNRKKGNPLDIQFVISCGNQGRATAINQNGVCICVDGDEKPFGQTLLHKNNNLKIESYVTDLKNEGNVSRTYPRKDNLTYIADEKNKNDLLYVYSVPNSLFYK
jgi:hypothetical protein